MRQRVLASALIALIVAACRGEGRITEPQRPPTALTALAAIGTDPTTGATVETNQDDYLPGEVVHVVGRGWAPNETVHLRMTEDPDTHDDVSRDVQADSTGAFALHFYDVQVHDLGVVFTLTATGQTSGSNATAVFTDGRVVTSATVNGAVPGAPITATTGQSLSFVVNGSTNTIAGTGNSAWVATSITFVPTPSGVVTTRCDETDVYTITNAGASGLSVSFAAIAPAVAGTYAAVIRAHQSNGCGAGQQSAPFPAPADAQFTLVVTAPANNPPTVSAGGPYEGNEGSAIPIDGTAADADGTVSSTTWSVVAAPAGVTCTFGNANLLSTTVTCDDNGPVTLALSATDDDGATNSANATVTVHNVAPTATFNSPSSVVEGSAINLSLTSPLDPSSADVAAGFQYAFDCGDGAGYSAYGAASTKVCPTSDDGTRTVGGRIKDKDDGETAYTASVTVTNAPPVITQISVPVVPIAVGNPVTVTWDFTDPGADTWECKISWDQPISYGSLFPSNAGGTARTCTATTSALPAGIYTVTVYVKDDDGGFDEETASAYIVVYDPSAGFVTGGGWVNSPVGAYVANPSLTGKANFGFVSKYKKGQTTPDGNTEFQFHAGNLNFKSTAYEWLVVSGSRAQYKGIGTINGSGTFSFMLSAIDGQAPGGGGTDRFRMKIWTVNLDGSESIVYDNQMGGSVDAEPTTAVGGGSINIQAK